MPTHYGGGSKKTDKEELLKKAGEAKMKEQEAKDKESMKEGAKSASNKMRKLTDKEKTLLSKHFEAKEHSKSEKARMRMAVMRSPKPVDTPAKIRKLHDKLFG